MTTILLALMVLLATAEPEADSGEVRTTNQAVHQLEIVDHPELSRSEVAGIELVWSDDRGQTWHANPAVGPEAKSVTFEARHDGIYYLSMVMFTKSGRRIPADVTRTPPDVMLLIDTEKPRVTLPVAERVGDEVQLEWDIKDQYPKDELTQVAYRPSEPAGAAWTIVPARQFQGRKVRFKPAFDGPVEVRVDVSDFALNTGHSAVRLPAGSGAGVATATAASGPPPVTPNPLGGGAVTPAAATSVEPVLPPPSMLPTTSPAVVMPPALPPGLTPAPPVATLTPAVPPTPVAEFTPVGTPALTPVAEPPAPVAEVKVFKSLRFDVAYDSDAGPSGVRQIDLYVTRDDGRTWARWSQHPAAERPLKIALDQSFRQRNPAPEGDYGFKFVAVSEGGLSHGPPPPGTPPEFRARIDVTAPKLEVYAPQPDPERRGAMVLRWKLVEANPAPNAVAVEWAASPSGPWAAVVGTSAGTGPGGVESLQWPVPEQIPARVYLRFTAADLAGNRLVTVSNQAFLVDTHRPTVRILSVSESAGGEQRP